MLATSSSAARRGLSVRRLTSHSELGRAGARSIRAATCFSSRGRGESDHVAIAAWACWPLASAAPLLSFPAAKACNRRAHGPESPHWGIRCPRSPWRRSSAAGDGEQWRGCLAVWRCCPRGTRRFPPWPPPRPAQENRCMSQQSQSFPGDDDAQQPADIRQDRVSTVQEPPNSFWQVLRRSWWWRSTRPSRRCCRR